MEAPRAPMRALSTPSCAVMKSSTARSAAISAPETARPSLSPCPGQSKRSTPKPARPSARASASISARLAYEPWASATAAPFLAGIHQRAGGRCHLDPHVAEPLEPLQRLGAGDRAARRIERPRLHARRAPALPEDERHRREQRGAGRPLERAQRRLEERRQPD